LVQGELESDFEIRNGLDLGSAEGSDVQAWLKKEI